MSSSSPFWLYFFFIVFRVFCTPFFKLLSQKVARFAKRCRVLYRSRFSDFAPPPVVRTSSPAIRVPPYPPCSPLISSTPMHLSKTSTSNSVSSTHSPSLSSRSFFQHSTANILQISSCPPQSMANTKSSRPPKTLAIPSSQPQTTMSQP